MVIYTKLASDGYLQSTQLHGLSADECIIFENYKEGIESVFNAHC